MSDEGQNIVLKLEAGLSFRENLDLQEWTLRKTIATTVMTTFLWVNCIVLALIIGMYVVDTVFIANGKIQHNDRIIETKVIMSIIGATTIQLGAIAFALSQWLFPKK
jgi:hypothetical protein